MSNPSPFGRVKFLNADTNLHTAWALRPSPYGDGPGVGVAGYEHFRVQQRGAGQAYVVGIPQTAGPALLGQAIPNAFLGGDAAGFSTPNTLNGLTDMNSLTSAVTLAPVPLVTLSVG